MVIVRFLESIEVRGIKDICRFTGCHSKFEHKFHKGEKLVVDEVIQDKNNIYKFIIKNEGTELLCPDVVFFVPAGTFEFCEEVV